MTPKTPQQVESLCLVKYDCLEKVTINRHIEMNKWRAIHGMDYLDILDTRLFDRPRNQGMEEYAVQIITEWLEGLHKKERQ